MAPKYVTVAVHQDKIFPPFLHSIFKKKIQIKNLFQSLDWKNYQVYSCLRDWRLSAIMQCPIEDTTLKPLEQHSTMLSRD